MKFSIKQLDFFDSDSTIYFQTPASHRLRIDTSHFENHSNLLILREFIHSVFPGHENINMTGIGGYYIGSKRVWQKQCLKDAVKLTNWQETNLLDEEERRYFCITVKDITAQEVYALCKQTAQGRKCSNLMFYTANRVLYISADVLDLTMMDQGKLRQICSVFHPFIDTHYPTIKTM